MTRKQILGAVVLCILVMIIVSAMRSDNATEANRDNLRVNIGKTLCNATNNECRGEILDIKPCEVAPELDCYVVDYGPDYSRPAERPVSNTYGQ